MHILTKVFIFIALLPTIIVATFATISINFGVDGGVSSNFRQVVENSMLAAEAYENEQKNNLIKDINYLSKVLNEQRSQNFFLGEANIREILSQFQPKNISEAFIIDFFGDIRVRGDRSYLFDFELIGYNNFNIAIDCKNVIIPACLITELRATQS